MPPSAAAIIPAAGHGARMNLDHPKQYHLLAGQPVLIHTVRAFRLNAHIGQIVVVVPPAWLERTRELLDKYRLTHNLTVTAGGKRRQDSVLAGLAALTENIDIVLVHDGARPLVSDDLINRCYNGAICYGAVIAAIPVKDTLKRCSPTLTVTGTIDRDSLWQAQTPQAASLQLLKQAYAQIDDQDVTDEASLLELAGIPVTIVEGTETNIKITRPDDFVIAEKIMNDTMQKQSRIGHGFDAHRLVPERKLVLGGLTIPHDRGLAGHSDADVLTHALCDAILGALGEGDIGRHFPDSEPRFHDIYSITLLDRVSGLMEKKGFNMANADITLICQNPKISPYVKEMRDILARTCRTEPERINIKATTTEGMGYTGRMEGISCHAVVLLESHNPLRTP
jgi:2-C-methyl-D-erythritol 4-phosphate cytidylyltransferase / 2-C-methyl-D-erythritol 2,4-cyclodiphosphate synthase